MATDIRPKSKVIKSQLGVFGFDAKQLKGIESALATLPVKLRGKPLYSAQRKGLNITKKAAQNNAQASSRTGGLKEAIQVVRGRDKSYDPYMVLRVNPDKEFFLPPPTWLNKGKPQKQRPIKYAHLVAGGTRGGLRENRELQDGTRKHFTVQNQETGGVHRLSQWLTPKKPGIMHPGTPANNFIEDAWESTRDKAEAKFRDTIIPTIEKFKQNQGFR